MPRVPESEKNMPGPLAGNRIREYAPRQVFDHHIPLSPPADPPPIGSQAEANGDASDKGQAPHTTGSSRPLPNPDQFNPPNKKSGSLRQMLKG